MNTFRQLTMATLKDLLRDRMATFWFLAFPLIFTLLFGMIFSNMGQDVHYKIGVALEDGGPMTTGILHALESVPVFTVDTGTEQAELQYLRKGERSLVIVLPAGVSRSAMMGVPVQIPVYYDATDRLTNQVLLPAVSQIFDEAERRMTNHPKIFAVAARAVNPRQVKEIDYLLPGILAMALMQLGLFGALRLVSLREQKILKRLGATPLPRWTLVASEVVVRLIMAVLQTLLIVVVGRLVFHVSVVGPWWQVAGLVLLGAATFISMGYMLTSFSKTEEAAQGLVQVVQFPMMFLSGIFFPLNIMPKFLEPVVRAIPLTYLGDALRQVMVGAPPTYSMGLEIGILLAWMVMTLGLSIRLFRWD